MKKHSYYDSTTERFKNTIEKTKCMFLLTKMQNTKKKKKKEKEKKGYSDRMERYLVFWDLTTPYHQLETSPVNLYVVCCLSKDRKIIWFQQDKLTFIYGKFLPKRGRMN